MFNAKALGPTPCTNTGLELKETASLDLQGALAGQAGVTSGSLAAAQLSLWGGAWVMLGQDPPQPALQRDPAVYSASCKAVSPDLQPGGALVATTAVQLLRPLPPSQARGLHALTELLQTTNSRGSS